MYRFYINKTEDDYHFMELARVFLPDDSFETIAYCGKPVAHLLRENSFFINEKGSDDREEIKREFYELLSDLTGLRPPWGTLTGVRPLKPALEMCRDTSVSAMETAVREKYLLSGSKASLLADIADYQLTYVNGVPWEKASVYIGIPFCPTRCAYCSFASNVAPAEAHAAYLEDLLREISYAGDLAKQNGTAIESIYIGGGTPTTLSASQLETLIRRVADAYEVDPASLEFTVEAGRPDTITKDKLETLRALGIRRISINPQSMKAGLQTISRADADRKIAIVGDMGELGEEEERLHREVGKFAAQLPIDRMITVGAASKAIAEEAAAGIRDVRPCGDKEEAKAILREILAEENQDQGSIAFLCKASRFMALEELTAEIRAIADGANG